jgi:hypothetical protein
MHRILSTLAGLVLGLAVVPAVCAQSVPLADVAVCNEHAHRRAGAPSAAPGTRDMPPTLTPEPGMRTDPSGSIVAEAKDPLLEGMDADGLKDPAYRTAYRECMSARKERAR